MAEFSVRGPFEIPVRRETRAILVDQEALEVDFWQHNECRSHRGCYVFGLRASRGITPFYVGKTVASFESECFQPHKLLKYIEALAHRHRGTPVMFFVCLEGQGRPNAAAIARLEQQLIDLAVDQNDDLLNIVGTNEEALIIRGALGPRHGRASEAARAFRRMMGLPADRPAPLDAEDHDEYAASADATQPKVTTETADL